MVKAVWMAAVAAIGLTAAPAFAQQADQPSAVYDQSCDRACLIGVLGQYMGALRAGSPSAVPLADSYVYTENNVPLALGKGAWRTIRKVDESGLEVADPQTGNAAWFGAGVENDHPVIYAVRIHVADGRIDEIESVVHRKDPLPTPFGDTTNMTHDKEFGEILPPEQQRPRERLRAIADSYFDTVELNDGQVFAPFAEDCSRLEDAMRTAGGTEERSSTSGFPRGCEAQFRKGYFRINKRVRERRYPIIDTERGVVVSTAFFDHANEWDRYKLTDGTEVETWLKWPNSITLLEAFRIKDAEIQRIEAVFTYVPYGMHNPWYGPASTPPASTSSPAQCDSQCLAGLAGKVMDGYVHRGSWKGLPWAKEVGYEENSVGLQVNEGIWGSTTAIDDRPLVIADATLGRALWLGRIDEQGKPAWAAVTVSADGDRIGRIETLVRREEYGAPYAKPVSAPSFAALPASRRTSRADMLAVVDRYYAAIAARSATAPAELDAGCRLTVNGQALATCGEAFTGGWLDTVEQIRDRKVIAVDEARGLVAVSAYEDYPAAAPAPATGYPRTLQVVDLFRIESGRIARIEGYTSELGYGTKPR